MTETGSQEIEFDALLEQVVLLMQRRRYDQASRYIAEGLKSHPDSLPLLYYSALLDWQRDRNADAMATVTRLLTIDPTDYSGRHLLANLQAELGDLAGSEQTWISLLRDHPDSASLYVGYGRLMLNTLNVDKARRLVAEAMRRDPHDDEVLFLAGLCDLVDGRQSDASKHLETLIRHHPDKLASGHALILMLEQRGRSRDALRVAQQLLRASPDSSTILEVVRRLKVQTHWTMLPLYPIMRWGWPFAIGIWMVMAFLFPVVAKGLSSQVVIGITVTWFVYCLYSWVWPRLLPRLI